MAFEAVADTLHFGRAAERLGIAQPAVSQLIRRLEEQLGVTLFERTSHRVTITPAGQELLPDARSAVATVRRRRPERPSWRREPPGRCGSPPRWPRTGSRICCAAIARRIRWSSWICRCSRRPRSSRTSPPERSTWPSSARHPERRRAWRAGRVARPFRRGPARRASRRGGRPARLHRPGPSAPDGHPAVRAAGDARRAAGRVPVHRGRPAGTPDPPHAAGDAGHDRDRRGLDAVHRGPRPERCARGRGVRATRVRTAEPGVAAVAGRSRAARPRVRRRWRRRVRRPWPTRRARAARPRSRCPSRSPAQAGRPSSA